MCALVCVWGEGTKRRVREGGWGDEIGVQQRHQDGLESQPGGRVGGGEKKGRSGRRRTASRPAPGSGGSARAGAWRVTETTLLGKRDRVAGGVGGGIGEPERVRKQ